MPSRQNRTIQRLLLHHLPLALVTAAGLLGLQAFLATTADDQLFIWSMATGYMGLALLCATLVVGAVNVVRGRRNPVSTDIRRDIGIWAGLLGLAHVLVGIQVHFRGRWWMYFVREVGGTPDVALRWDLFGFANYTGMGATIILVLLLALSNDLSLRRLKARRWKSLQRWNYGLMLLVAVHAAAYQIVEQRQAGFVALLTLFVLGTVAAQALGFRLRRRWLVPGLRGGDSLTAEHQPR